MAKMTLSRCRGNAAYWARKAEELEKLEGADAATEAQETPEIPNIDIEVTAKPDESGIVTVNVCPYCGSEIQLAENTCHTCGKPIAWPELADSPDYVVCEKCGCVESVKTFAGACRRCGFAG